VLVVLPVERAAAASPYGPDGYFSALDDTDGDGQILPIVDAETSVSYPSGWSRTRKIVFGKQKDTDASTPGNTYADARVSGGYKTLGYGGVPGIASENLTVGTGSLGDAATSRSSHIGADEALLWADSSVTAGFKFDINSSGSNTFDDSVEPYRSNIAEVSLAVADENYSTFEKTLIRADYLEGVCAAAHSSGCSGGSGQQSPSAFTYPVFPISTGDIAKYLNHQGIGGSTNRNLVADVYAANGSWGTWLRTPNWSNSLRAYQVHGNYGTIEYLGNGTDTNRLAYYGLRPALRLQLGKLLLAGDHKDQSQSASGDLRLTFVDDAAGSLSGASATAVKSRLTLSGSHGLQDGFGFKLVDPAEPTKVVASGLSASGVVDVSRLPGVVSGTAYDVYWWGQANGTADTGWSNRATEPQMTSLTFTVPSYGIEVSGQTAGGLKAYRIGDYAESVFDHTGALKSVKLSTPAGVKSVLAAAAGSAGGSGVDGDNPVGWVASQWLGYPADSLSDDVTSAYSPFAGKLQLFARELAGKSDAELGGVKGSLPAGTFASLATETLTVSGPGLYLIVDSSQASGGSLPIIVGSKVFNEDLGDEGRFVDFVDAGVKGKPRLGVAVLKTTVTDVAKRIVNDAGLDGFDVGASVEYEIALRVPDLSGFSSVSYASYAFDVVDVAEPGLTLPVVSGVRVLVDVPSPDTEVTNTSGLTLGVSGDTLTVAGLKAVFAEDSGGHVANKAALPAGSLIRIRYMAVLNTNASFSAPGGGALDPNVNTVTLTRSMSDGTSETRSAAANAYSFKLDVVKVDKDEVSRPLGGAGFEVSRDGQALKFVDVGSGVYRLAVPGDAAPVGEVFSHADGTLTLLGVEARELSFRETTAPSGYFTVSDFRVEVIPVWNPDASEVTVASYRTNGSSLAYVSQDGRSVVVADPSKSLANLPYTGGVGILLLLIIGGVFLVVAVRPYYLSHRAEATANILI
ncbi:MAG: hypothetical protein SOI15_02655, partial [Bifidobacterium crudilactis]|jgi:hypothetical protein